MSKVAVPFGSDELAKTFLKVEELEGEVRNGCAIIEEGEEVSEVYEVVPVEDVDDMPILF